MRRVTLFRIITCVLVGLFCIPLAILSYNAYHSIHDEDAYARNQKINERNGAFAEGNSFCFTDIERAFKNPKKKYRIAVLGDSFVWGDGLPYQKLWNHKLEAKLLADYDSIEVLHWGIGGWSTVDEFNFFKEHGKDFDINLLIIGWVENDPALGDVQQVYFTDPAVRYPHLYRVCPGLARLINNHNEQDGYDEWIEYIFSQPNLISYQKVLDTFHQYLAAHQVPALYVMTPSSYNNRSQRLFEKGELVIRAANFPCLNLYGSMQKKFGAMPQEALMANPVNAHPGELLTEEFAKEVKAYLEKNNYLKEVPKKR